jgi:hypothetical protein
MFKYNDALEVYTVDDSSLADIGPVRGPFPFEQLREGKTVRIIWIDNEGCVEGMNCISDRLKFLSIASCFEQASILQSRGWSYKALAFLSPVRSACVLNRPKSNENTCTWLIFALIPCKDRPRVAVRDYGKTMDRIWLWTIEYIVLRSPYT